MTTAQMLEARGEARGRAGVLVQQLTTKFGPLPEETLARVTSGSASELRIWTDSVLTAGTLEQVFSAEPLAGPAAPAQGVPAQRSSRGIVALPGIRSLVRRVRARRSH